MHNNEAFLPLPDPLGGVFLTPAPMKVIKALMLAGDRGVTSPELERQCAVSASRAVSTLRQCGALIDTYPAPHTVRRRVLYSGETRYVYRGWDPEAPRRARWAFPQKEKES